MFGADYNGPWEFFAKLFIEGNGKFYYMYAVIMYIYCRRREDIFKCVLFIIFLITEF